MKKRDLFLLFKQIIRDENTKGYTKKYNTPTL
jgi:hypothetical protein